MSGRDHDPDLVLDSDAAGDPRLERELRDLLRRRDPGAAPYPLRGRIDRVPEARPRAGRGRQLATGLASLAGTAVAAGLVVAVVAGVVGRTTGVGGGPGTGPGGPATTGVVYDPMATGIGVVTPLVPLVSTAPIAAVLLAIAGLLALAWRRRHGRLVLLPLTGALALAIAGGLVVQQPPPQQDLAGAATEGVVTEAGSTGSVVPGWGTIRQVMRVAVGPGQPYGLAIALKNPGPWPVHVEGFVDEFRDPASGVPTMSAWFDRRPDVMGDPATAFEPFDLGPGDRRVVDVSRLADRCAIAGIVIPADWAPVAAPADESLEVVEQTTLRLRWSVLGWLREDTIQLPFEFLTYLDPACTAAREDVPLP